MDTTDTARIAQGKSSFLHGELSAGRAAVYSAGSQKTTGVRAPRPDETFSRLARYGGETCARFADETRPVVRLATEKLPAKPADPSLPENRPIKQKRGFFASIGHALKKFARSGLGRITLLAGAIAGSFLIPGLGAAAGKIFAGLGKGLLGGLAKLGVKPGMAKLLAGELKSLLKEEVRGRLGGEGGLRNILKDAGRVLLRHYGLDHLLNKDGLKRTVLQLAERLGIGGTWLSDLLGATPPTAAETR